MCVVLGSVYATEDGRDHAEDMFKARRRMWSLFELFADIYVDSQAQFEPRSSLVHRYYGPYHSPIPGLLHKNSFLFQTTISFALQIFVTRDCSFTKTMAPTDVVVPMPPTSPRPPETPPSSPTLPACEHVLTFKHVQQFFELLKAVQAAQTLPDKAQTTDQVTEEQVVPKEPRARASKLEFKTVDERYIHHSLYT